MFRISSALSFQYLTIVWCLLSLVGLAVVPIAEASVAATDFGDPADAPFGARRGAAAGVPNAIHNMDTGEFFDTLQAAIDDADTMTGHTLQLEVALQPEGQVLITKSVTLLDRPGPRSFRRPSTPEPRETIEGGSWSSRALT